MKQKRRQIKSKIESKIIFSAL
uniref:Uncharacterized protein n=1 Tax=Arundo donax TaxID=35708 RepID=A0A0A8ZRE7_ARUDO